MAVKMATTVGGITGLQQRHQVNSESLDDAVSMVNNAERLQVRLFTVRFFSLFLFQRARLQTTTLRLRDWGVTRKDGLRTTKTLLYLGFRVQ